MRDTDYIFSVARIRVKEKALLTNADVKQMVNMKDADSVLSFLTSHGWGADTQEKTAESVLMAEEAATMKMMEELGLDQEILDILSFPKVFHNLKSAVKETVTTDPHADAFYDLTVFGREEALRLVRNKEYDAMPAVVRGVAPGAFELMLKTRDSQKVDQMVDKACLEAMAAAGRKAKNPLLAAYLSLTVALADIRIAVRAQKMRKDLSFLQTSLAACDRLDVTALARAASDSEEEFHKYLTSAGFKDAAEALKKSLSAFEVWCDDQLTLLTRSEKNNIESVGPVLAFYLARETEIKTARIILTAKANGFPDSVIEERARLMYV